MVIVPTCCHVLQLQITTGLESPTASSLKKIPQINTIVKKEQRGSLPQAWIAGAKESAIIIGMKK